MTASTILPKFLYEKKRHTELGGGIARISLNKPTKMNTLTLSTVDEMFRAFYDANHDPMIGVIVVAAKGKHFGAGGDVDWERWGSARGILQSLPAQPPDAHVAQTHYCAGTGLLPGGPQPYGLLLRFYHCR